MLLLDRETCTRTVHNSTHCWPAQRVTPIILKLQIARTLLLIECFELPGSRANQNSFPKRRQPVQNRFVRHRLRGALPSSQGWQKLIHASPHSMLKFPEYRGRSQPIRRRHTPSQHHQFPRDDNLSFELLGTRSHHFSSGIPSMPDDL